MDVKHVPVLIVGAGVGGLARLRAARQTRGPLPAGRKAPRGLHLSESPQPQLPQPGRSSVDWVWPTEVHAVAEQVSAMVVKPTLNSAAEEPAIDIDAIFAGLDTLSPEPAAQYCPQSRSEPILRDASDAVAARCGTARSCRRSNSMRPASPRWCATARRGSRRRSAPTISSAPTECTARSATRWESRRPATARCRSSSCSSTSGRLGASSSRT